MALPSLPQDKANHLAYGACIAVVVGYIGHLLHLPAGYVGLGAAVVFGAAKEAVDYYQNRQLIKAGQEPTHGVELNDFLATAGGGLLATALKFLT